MTNFFQTDKSLNAEDFVYSDSHASALANNDNTKLKDPENVMIQSMNWPKKNTN
jgi:hypothetical protein